MRVLAVAAALAAIMWVPADARADDDVVACTDGFEVRYFRIHCPPGWLPVD